MFNGANLSYMTALPSKEVQCWYVAKQILKFSCRSIIAQKFPFSKRFPFLMLHKWFVQGLGKREAEVEAVKWWNNLRSHVRLLHFPSLGLVDCYFFLISWLPCRRQKILKMSKGEFKGIFTWTEMVTRQSWLRPRLPWRRPRRTDSSPSWRTRAARWQFFLHVQC